MCDVVVEGVWVLIFVVVINGVVEVLVCSGDYCCCGVYGMFLF